jgi:hypothetical protein
MKSTLVVVLSILALRFLFGGLPVQGGWVLDVIVLVAVLTLLGIHARVIVKVIKSRRFLRESDSRWDGEPELLLISENDFDLQRPTLTRAGRVLFAIRQHVALALPALLPLCAAIVLTLMSVLLFILYPYIPVPSFTVRPPDFEFMGKAVELEDRGISTPDFHIVIWWIPLLLVIRMVLWAARIWQNWKWDPLWTLTEKYFYIMQFRSALFPHPTETKYRTIRTNQITEVEDSTGYWGTFFGGLIFRSHGEFGTIKLTIQSTQKKDEPDKVIVLRWVPRASEVAQLIRSVSTDLRDEVELAFAHNEPAEDAETDVAETSEPSEGTKASQ